VAGSVVSGYSYELPENVSLEQFFRVMFYVLRYTDGEYVVQWVNSTRCADKYSERIADPANPWFAS